MLPPLHAVYADADFIHLPILHNTLKCSGGFHDTRSVTFAPFVKPMPAFLHNFIFITFEVDYSDYHVIFLTDLCARQGASPEQLMGLSKQFTHDKKDFISVKGLN